MKTLTIAILMLAVPTFSAFATAQWPDKIIYEGKEYRLCTYPIEDNSYKYLEKEPKSGITCTALRRGYVATFEIRREALFLTDIEIFIGEEIVDGKLYQSWKSVKDQVLPEGDDQLVDSFTGILVLEYYYGEKYGETVEDRWGYILLDVKNGRLTGKRSLDYMQYEEFREKQFQAYKKTDEYKQWVEMLKSTKSDREWSQEMIDRFLRGYEVANYTSKFFDEEEKKEASNKTSGGGVQ